MRETRPTFRRRAVRPVDCLRAGWRLIRDDYWLFLGISVVGVIIGSLAPLGLLMGPAMCGVYHCLLRRVQGRRVSFEMLFRGFDHFIQSLIATLVMIVPVMALLIPAYVLFFAAAFAWLPQQRGGGPPDPDGAWALAAAAGLFMLAVVVVSVVVGALFIFTYPLIADRGLTGLQAVGTSIRAVLGNLGGVLGLVLLNHLLGLVGVLACYVGAIFVMPLSFAAVAIAYEQVFPRDDGAAADLPLDGGPA